MADQTIRTDVQTMVRSYEVDDFEIERADGGDGRTITVQAVPYNVAVDIPSEGIRERFAPGAFAHQIPAIHRVQATYLHQSQGGEVIGRLHTGQELASGLRVSMRISNTTRGNDTLELVRDRAITQVSIGFRAKRAWSKLGSDGVTERTRADLFEVSLVPEGAYRGHATVQGIRSLTDALREGADVEFEGLETEDETSVDELRAEGMSVEEARALVRAIPLLPASLIGR
jgi:HK97 family phage prohead protease